LSKRAILYDVDSKIPNLALMKISSFYKRMGYDAVLSRQIQYIEGCRHFAGVVFHAPKSLEKVAALRSIYGADIDIGGSGVDLIKRLPVEIEHSLPDYDLYPSHKTFAIGYITRGCNNACEFCLVPVKEGIIKQVSSFEQFVPPGQRNVMLLDDNLLSFHDADRILTIIVQRDYAVNFSQSLDIRYLNENNIELLKRVDSRNSKFTKRRFYFSCNNVATIRQFMEKRKLLSALGEGAVTTIMMYGFSNHLSEDYQIFRMIRKLRLIPFLQEYWPIPGVPARVSEDYFDYDLNAVIRLTFLSNGVNWEKYLRWLNRLYFKVFGKYYLPLVKIIYRYNNKERILRYLRQPEKLTEELYKPYG